MKTVDIHARIELKTKVKAESVLCRLGITHAEAIRIFYTQISLHGKLPFVVEIPGRLTRETLDKSQRGEDVDTFDTLEDMFASWET